LLSVEGIERNLDGYIGAVAYFVNNTFATLAEY
jgi:hypothetical protein